MSLIKNKLSLFYILFGTAILFMVLCSFEFVKDQSETKLSATSERIDGTYLFRHVFGVEVNPSQAPMHEDVEASTVIADTLPSRTVKVALVQFDAVPEQSERNLREMDRLIRQAAFQGARIVMFHELTLSDYTSRLDDFAESVPDGPACKRMGNLARELNCYVSFGLSEKDGKKNDVRFYITQVFFGPNGFVYRYRKTWLWWDYEENDKWYRKEPS